MLESLKINNLALIDKSTINFENGFNVLTGETGAGKSLIVDALLFLTGVRADKTLIKSGEDYARVDGVFSVSVNDYEINDVLSILGIDNDGTIIISRYFSMSGKNECRINGEIVTLNMIKKLSSLLIDIFGQNDSQILLDEDKHLMLTDNMFESSLEADKKILNEYLAQLADINKKIYDLGGLDNDRQNSIDLIKYQIEEIDSAGLKVGMEEELKSKITILENSEKIHNTLSDVLTNIDGEYNLSNSIKSAINSLGSITQFDDDYEKIKDRLYSIKYELEDIVDSVHTLKDSVSYSQQELDLFIDKLQYIKDLERKYGKTIEDILHKRDELDKRLYILLNADEELENLNKEKNKLLKDIYSVCLSLHKTREKNIAILRKKLVDELIGLGMKNASFDAIFTQDFTLDNIENLVTQNGADKLAYMFSANLGVELRPLSKIISGGEMSRFMLAFKSIQNSARSKTCIFDEIDTGIGGEIGKVVGMKICDVSRHNQVICITHLPTIAGFGDVNFKIEKYDENGKTITTVTKLDYDLKVREIARMLGNSSSEITLAHAMNIVSDCNHYKMP